MNIIVERKKYDLELSSLLPDEFRAPVTGGWNTKYIGYHNDGKGQITFVLPKGFDEYERIDSGEKPQQQIDLIKSWPLVIYSVLKKYRKKLKSDRSNETASISTISQRSNSQDEHTLLDVITGLVQIHHENPYIYFKEKVYTKKSRHKTDWKKTVRKKFPLIDTETVVYFDEIGYDSKASDSELLLVIFYSTIYKISKDLNTRIEVNESIPILKNHQMTRFEKKVSKVLKNIKGRYYSDLHRKIHYYLTEYYDLSGMSSTKKVKNEYLLASNFELIFEDMVDEFVSDPNDIRMFKKHDDGKILDHIYHDKSIINRLNEFNAFYVGDSKYYASWKDLYKSKSPIYKQYTYCTNIINQCVEADLKDDMKVKNHIEQNNILVWDRENRSYHPIVSFFVLPDNSDLNEVFTGPLMDVSTGEIIHNISYHYEDRIFDRNTIFILYFRINIQRLMQFYMGNGTIKKDKDNFRKMIREEAVRLYEKSYVFDESASPGSDKDGKVFAVGDVTVIGTKI